MRSHPAPRGRIHPLGPGVGPTGRRWRGAGRGAGRRVHGEDGPVDPDPPGVGVAAPRLHRPRQGTGRPRGRSRGTRSSGRSSRRAGVCEHLPVVAGGRPTAPGEGIFTRRSLALIGAKIGSTVEVEAGGVRERRGRRHRRPRAGAHRPGGRRRRPRVGRVADWRGRPYFSFVLTLRLPLSGPLVVRPPDGGPGVRRTGLGSARPDHDAHRRRAGPAAEGGPRGRRDPAEADPGGSPTRRRPTW